MADGRRYVTFEFHGGEHRTRNRRRYFQMSLTHGTSAVFGIAASLELHFQGHVPLYCQHTTCHALR